MQINENGRDEFFHGGSDKSGITFSFFGLDLQNDHAQNAYHQLVKAKKADGGLSVENEQYLNDHYKDVNPSKEVVQKFQDILGPTLKSEKGQEIIEEAVKGAKEDNELWLDWVNEQSLRDRGRIFNPIEQANLSIWSHRANGLKETLEGWDAGSIKADRKNISTKDLLNWIKSQKNFNTKKDKDPAIIRNKNNQWKQHLINIGTIVERGIGAGIIQSGDVTRESQDALNAALKEAGSEERFSFVAE